MPLATCWFSSSNNILVIHNSLLRARGVLPYQGAFFTSHCGSCCSLRPLCYYALNNIGSCIVINISLAIALHCGGCCSSRRTCWTSMCWASHIRSERNRPRLQRRHPFSPSPSLNPKSLNSFESRGHRTNRPLGLTVVFSKSRGALVLQHSSPSSTRQNDFHTPVHNNG